MSTGRPAVSHFLRHLLKLLHQRASCQYPWAQRRHRVASSTCPGRWAPGRFPATPHPRRRDQPDTGASAMAGTTARELPARCAAPGQTAAEGWRPSDPNPRPEETAPTERRHPARLATNQRARRQSRQNRLSPLYPSQGSNCLFSTLVGRLGYPWSTNGPISWSMQGPTK